MNIPSLILDLETLVGLVILSFIVRQTLQKIIKPLIEKEPLAQAWPFYLAFAAGSVACWFSGLNALPVFPDETVGRVLSCLAAGHGPSVVHDIVAGIRDFLKNWPVPQESVGS